MSDSESTPSRKPVVGIEQFAALEMRVGRIVRAEAFPAARKPAYRLWVDFGPLGVKQSSAQITVRYALEELVGRLVVGVVNLPPRQIAHVRSEVLVLGALGPDGDVCLLTPEAPVELGALIA